MNCYVDQEANTLYFEVETSSNAAEFHLNEATNPTSTKPTGNFQLCLLDSEERLVADSELVNFLETTTAASIEYAKLSQENNFPLSESYYDFEF